jgi:hypothetical protein
MGWPTDGKSIPSIPYSLTRTPSEIFRAMTRREARENGPFFLSWIFMNR